MRGGRLRKKVGEDMELQNAARGTVVSLFDMGSGVFGGTGRAPAGTAAARGRGVRFPAIAQVDAYWEGLRAGRLMPDRSEVDPRGLETALEYAFLLEYIAPGVGRIRVAGSHLNDLLGMEVRGMPLTALFTPDARERVGKLLETVVSGPRVADVTLEGERGIGRPPLAGRMYLAPLENDGSGGPRLLGCLQSAGTPGRAPRRFTVDAVHLRRIVATAGPGMPAAPALPQPAVPGFAEPAARFTAPKRKRPNLRLVKNGD